MEATRVITKIEANPLLIKQNDENAVLNVCAYCRVSTDMEDQLNSYKAQVEYYTDIISKNPKWRLVGIYADEGITGTQTKKREEFKRMIKDCRKGKVDLILTKSVARFARNTVDTLNYVRELKSLGISVHFEEQNLDSIKMSNEMIIGVHSVIAQAESENISENVKWGIRHRMKTGQYTFRDNLLGYKNDEQGNPQIVEEEAEIVRKIFQLYLDGNTLDQIKTYLEENKILTYKGKTTWNKATIQNMLKNEKYSGDILLQKSYIDNCITKKSKKNHGELPKYLILNNHAAIIDKVTFKEVQREMARRSGKTKVSSKSITSLGKYSKYALTDLLVCGCCGSPYQRRTWKLKGVNQKVWRCLSRVENGKKYCQKSITIEETKLQELICKGLTQAVENQDEVIAIMIANIEEVITGKQDGHMIYAIEQQLKELNELRETAINLRIETEGDKTRITNEIKKLTDEIKTLREQLEFEKSKITAKESVNIEVERIKKILLNYNNQPLQYDEIMIRALIERIRVMPDKILQIMLKGGITLEQSI